MPTLATASAEPAPQLRDLVGRYSTARYEGFPAGVHLGHPSDQLEFIVCLGNPTSVGRGDGSTQAYRALVAGLHIAPMPVFHSGSFDNVSLELTPRGARALFGMPAAELAHRVIALDEALGCDSDELVERMAGAHGPAGRFAILDDVLCRRASRFESNERGVNAVWQRILASGGTMRVHELAEEFGYSRRHLTARYSGEYGITPKQAARIVRFQRSRSLIRRYEQFRRQRPGCDRLSLTDVAVRCGYYDQAHLAREWLDLGGVPPSTWVKSEDLPFVQAGSADATGVFRP